MSRKDSASRRGFPGLSLWLAAGTTLAFYALVHSEIFEGTSLRRYTTEHPVEYVTITMFFWAMTDLALKLLVLWRERSALKYDWLPRSQWPESPTAATELFGRLRSAPQHLTKTILGRRLRDALRYVRDKRSADQLEDHLKYLAEIEADQAHQQFGLVRVIAWMIPILGFLGTVMGITLAIANVSPEQLETSLHEVTGGLAVAFDTTAVALSLSMVLMFVNMLVEKQQQALILDVEIFASRELAHRFLAVDREAVPYLRAIEAASQKVIAHTGRLLEQQIELWSKSMTDVREQNQKTTEKIDAQLQRSLASLKDRWHEQREKLDQNTERMQAISKELRSVAEILLRVISGEGQLLASQKRLTENLRAIQKTSRIDEALHSLTAAIHLMTAREGQGEDLAA